MCSSYSVTLKSGAERCFWGVTRWFPNCLKSVIYLSYFHITQQKSLLSHSNCVRACVQLELQAKVRAIIEMMVWWLIPPHSLSLSPSLSLALSLVENNMLKQDKHWRKEGMRSIPWLGSAFQLVAVSIDFLSLLLHEQGVSSLHLK